MNSNDWRHRALPDIGSVWAYRASGADPLVEVVVLRIGQRRPQRILVRFVSDEFEGLQDWVSPARLKAPWDEAEAFLARERRWDAVIAESPDRDDPTVYAADIVIGRLVDPTIASVGYNATEGVLLVHDVTGLARFLDLGPKALQANPAAFVEDGDLVAPWPVTLMVAKRAAQRDPEGTLRYVDKEEARARLEPEDGDGDARRAVEGLPPSPDLGSRLVFAWHEQVAAESTLTRDERRAGSYRGLSAASGPAWCAIRPRAILNSGRASSSGSKAASTVIPSSSARCRPRHPRSPRPAGCP